MFVYMFRHCTLLNNINLLLLLLFILITYHFRTKSHDAKEKLEMS